MKLNKNKGFTLIELLVVISIITLLSSIVLSAVRTAQAKSQIARLFEDEHQIQNQFDIIRDANNKVLGEINGDWCNMCDFNSTTPVKKQKSAVTKDNQAFQALGFSKGAPLDPWGNPYILDANEGEGGYACGRYDGVYSAGPNGLWESANYTATAIPTLPSVQNGTNDDYLLYFSLFRCTTPALPG